MSFQRAAAWDDGGANDRAGRDEARVRRGFWPKVGRVAARLPFAEDFLAAYYCAFDRATPLQVRAALLAALAYFVLPFAEDLVTAYYCAFDRNTPLQVKAALVGALAYFILPYDIVPDLLPALGFADDAAVLAAALRLVATHIRPEHRDAAREALARGMEAE